MRVCPGLPASARRALWAGLIENVSMEGAESSIVAWDLVEHCRSALTTAELNTAFVRLGVGEYGDAIDIVLKANARSAGPPLTEQLIARLTHWAKLRYRDRELEEFLAFLQPGNNAGAG